MKISLKWVNEFVDIQDEMKKPEELAEKLTRAGLEVEEVINKTKDYAHVVVGLILEKEKHPNADKLSLCRVTTGEGVVHQIVCGAQNHKSGDRIVVALPGAVLPGNFQIKNSTIRGIESAGMLCSAKELNLPVENDGLLILPTDAPVGKLFSEYKGLNDILMVLKVTPNRADALSHYGLARELACLLGKELKHRTPEFSVDATSTKSEMKLEVKSADLCPRYSGRLISDVKVGPSPDWLRNRLESLGMNSINNIVDVTNYVMMELGQPLHAFDADQIQGRKVIVAKASAKEKFIKLDGTEITLLGDELTIRDSERALCLAGVVGGKNSGVTDTTKNIFLEAAYFNPMSVRKTSRKHGIETDSAYRFSRGVDSDGALRASDRATELILKVAGGKAFNEPHDFYPEPLKKSWISLELQTVTDRLGFAAEEKIFTDFMKSLGCQIKASSSGKFEVLPPSFRFDLEGEMDLVEEYARLIGYEHIPERIPEFNKAPLAHDKNYLLDLKVSKALIKESYYQAFNFAFVSGKQERNFLGSVSPISAAGLKISEEPIQLLNPLNEDLNIMRSTLTFGLTKNLLTNFHYGNKSGRLFEIGRCFSKEPSSEAYEQNRLSLLAWGHPENLWNKNTNAPLVFEIKAAIESLLKQLRIQAYSWETPQDKGLVPHFLHMGQFVHLLVEGKKLGYLGSLHPVWLEENKVRCSAAVAEIDLEALYKGQPRQLRFLPVSKFPMVERDFAFVMTKTVKVDEVLKAAKKLGGNLLSHSEVFDVYQGDKMEAGKKSVAIRLIFQDIHATLQDAQIQEVQNKIIEGLKLQFDLSLR
ncbi:MAG: phenylalanine--tRNA ligase subunit beta [Bdellovibrionota bacterium]